MNDEIELREVLFPLLDALIGGHITNDDHALLEALLDDHPQARQFYSQYLEHDHQMRQLQLSDSQPNAVEEMIRRAADETTDSTLRPVLLGAMLATAACLLVALLLYGFWGATNSNSDPVIDHVEERGGYEAKPRIAKIMRMIDVRWGDGHDTFAMGDSLGREWLHVSSGVVKLEFSSGAVLVLEGPAQLRLNSETECFVQKGKVVVLGPPDLPEFTIMSPGSRVVDKGTEFAVVVSEAGETDVHVLDGEVDVSLLDASQGSVGTERLLVFEAATLNPAQSQIRSLTFDGQSFEQLRPNNLARSQPVRIQFDCGVLAGVYDGVQSPAHAVGQFYKHERFWNPIIGDQSGKFVGADGTLLSSNLEVDFGQVRGQNEVDWNEPLTSRGSSGKSHGVFHTSLGEDGIRGGNRVGMRIRGLPKGNYRVFVIGRSSIVHPNWGNFLIDKAYNCSIGIGQVVENIPVDPLDDEMAKRWVDGQTHVASDVAIGGPDEYLTVIVSKDGKRSPVPAGGGATILGVQIMQLTD